jgi:hypothetical protein
MGLVVSEEEALADADDAPRKKHSPLFIDRFRGAPVNRSPQSQLKRAPNIALITLSAACTLPYIYNITID